MKGTVVRFIIFVPSVNSHRPLKMHGNGVSKSDDETRKNKDFIYGRGFRFDIIKLKVYNKTCENHDIFWH
jgi:hypothetical protein